MTAKQNRLRCELTKVRREIETHGEEYTFFRNVLNKDGEPTGEAKQILSARGLFHVLKGYASRETSDATETHEKGQPALLCAWEDTTDIKNKDYTTINGQRYNVVAKNNIQEYNIVADISMEVFLNGNN